MQPRPDYSENQEVYTTIHDGKRSKEITLTVRQRRLDLSERKWYYRFEVDGKPYTKYGKEWLKAGDL